MKFYRIAIWILAIFWLNPINWTFLIGFLVKIKHINTLFLLLHNFCINRNLSHWLLLLLWYPFFMIQVLGNKIKYNLQIFTWFLTTLFESKHFNRYVLDFWVIRHFYKWLIPKPPRISFIYAKSLSSTSFIFFNWPIAFGRVNNTCTQRTTWKSGNSQICFFKTG